jgi:hypothetical protein
MDDRAAGELGGYCVSLREPLKNLSTLMRTSESISTGMQTTGNPSADIEHIPLVGVNAGSEYVSILSVLTNNVLSHLNESDDSTTKDLFHTGFPLTELRGQTSDNDANLGCRR